MKTLVVHGLNVPVSAADVSPVIWKALQCGSYEGKEARWALRAARPDDRILELGAGIGVIARLVGACVLFSRKLDKQREYYEDGERSVA